MFFISFKNLGIWLRVCFETRSTRARGLAGAEWWDFREEEKAKKKKTTITNLFWCTLGVYDLNERVSCHNISHSAVDKMSTQRTWARHYARPHMLAHGVRTFDQPPPHSPGHTEKKKFFFPFLLLLVENITNNGHAHKFLSFFQQAAAAAFHRAIST